MELTPLDIRNQNFSTKKLGGYDPEEVKAFLGHAASNFEELLVERADLLKTINNDKKSVESYQEKEKLLLGTITSMQQYFDEKKAQAYQEAEMIIAKAKMDAEKECDIIRNQVSDLRTELERLKQVRMSYFAQLRNIMRTQEDFLNSMEEKD
jgi:cell division initiation protein